MNSGAGNYSKLLTGKIQLSSYPMEKLKRVDKPTTKITDTISRFDERETGFARASRGEFGPIRDMKKLFSAWSAFSIDRALKSELNLLKAGLPNESARKKPPLPDAPAIMSRHIKSMAYFLGADIVGICELPQWAVYSHDITGNIIELNHRYAICIAADQGLETMEASTGSDWISGAQSQRGYATCGYMGFILANYIDMLGYPARLHYAEDYQVLVPPLLLLSGIGELSRAGIILNPFLGLRFKASVVTTDLPLEIDKPIDFGLQDFCSKCKKCAIECPSQSISQNDKIIKNGYEKWEFNSNTCTKFRIGNPNGIACGRCIKVCPWNKPKGRMHDFVRLMVKYTPLMNDYIIKMDGVLGYDKADKDKQWWFAPF